MSAGAWVMLVVGCVILYGGLAVCLFIAAGSRRYTNEDYEAEDNEEQA